MPTDQFQILEAFGGVAGNFVIVTPGWTSTPTATDDILSKPLRFHDQRKEMPCFHSNIRPRRPYLGKQRCAQGWRPLSLMACLGGFASQGRALGQARAVWNDQATVRKVAFSPDGKTLASFSSSPVAVRLWDVASGKAIASLPVDGLHGGCPLFTFTPDGKGLVASAGRDRTDAEGKSGLGRGRTVLWDVATRKVQTTIDLPPGAAVVALIPDGKTLIAGDEG